MITLFPQFTDRIDCRFLTKNDDRNVPDPRVCLNQIHGNRTILSREPMESSEEADGVITDQKGLHLFIRAADCQNFAVYDPVLHIGGVLHAGWKGIVAGAIPEFFRVFSDTFETDISQIFVTAGPSLCKACAEFSDPKLELPEIDTQYVDGRCVDLQKVAQDQMVAAGVLPQNFFRHPDCTCCQHESYWSYRGGDRKSVQNGQSNMLILTI
jgi:hypothetical protein